MRQATKILLVLLLFQIAVVGLRQLLPTRFLTLAVGQALPYPVQREDTAVKRFQGCRAAFICTTGCNWCARLADRVAESQRTGLFDEGGAPAWLILGSEVDRIQFAASHGLRDEDVYALARGGHRLGLHRELLDIPVTPLRIIWDGARVYDLSPSQVIPKSQELREACTPFEPVRHLRG